MYVEEALIVVCGGVVDSILAFGIIGRGFES